MMTNSTVFLYDDCNITILPLEPQQALLNQLNCRVLNRTTLTSISRGVLFLTFVLLRFTFPSSFWYFSTVCTCKLPYICASITVRHSFSTCNQSCPYCTAMYSITRASNTPQALHDCTSLTFWGH